MRRGNAGSDETIASQTVIPSRGGRSKPASFPRQPLVIPAQAGIQRGGAQEGQGGTAPAQPPNQSQYRAGGNPEGRHAGRSRLTI